MSKDFQKFIFFFFLWCMVYAFQKFSIFNLLIRFDFIIVYLSAFYLFRLTMLSNYGNISPIPPFYKFVMTLLLLWVFVNIFRDPPTNVMGFLRFLAGPHYVAAFYPLLLFYFGSKISAWSQIWHYAVKFNKLFVILSPLIIVLFITQNIVWPYLFILIYFFPIMIVNWELLKTHEKVYLVISLIVALAITIFGGSRFLTLRILYYLPLLYLLFLLKMNSRSVVQLFMMSVILVGAGFLGNYIYEGNLNSTKITKSEEGVKKFTNTGFENSRKEYAYPDFFLDMKEIQDWILGRGINGSYYSKIFDNVVDKDLNEKNSLGVKRGYRANIECGYLQVIMKIGVVGLILQLMLALPAVYLGLFRSKNWFVRGCAFIIIEWLIGMYPAALPEWAASYMLFWLCIGACLSRETRNAGSSAVFLKYLWPIQNNNKSFFLINRF